MPSTPYRSYQADHCPPCLGARHAARAGANGARYICTCAYMYAREIPCMHYKLLAVNTRQSHIILHRISRI